MQNQPENSPYPPTSGEKKTRSSFNYESNLGPTLAPSLHPKVAPRVSLSIDKETFAFSEIHKR